MKQSVAWSIECINLMVSRMTDDERAEVFQNLDYCTLCGSKSRKGERCNCTRDE